MSKSKTKPSPRPESGLDWKWQVAQRLAKSGRSRSQQNLVAAQVLDAHLPPESLNSRGGIAATIALTALTDALREQNELQRRRQTAAAKQYEQQRSLLEALVQCVVVFFLLIGVGGYAAIDWATTKLDGSINALRGLPGIGFLFESGQDNKNGLPPSDGAYIPNSEPFAPLEIATPYLYDDSPPGAWDFTLIDPTTRNTAVNIPSPCPGIIDETGFQARAGNYLWLTCNDGTRWFLAHLKSHAVAAEAPVKLGQSLGVQGTTGNSTGDHIHAVIDPVDGNRQDRTATKPVLDAAFALWKRGNNPQVGQGAQEAIDLVKDLEGLHLTAYPDGTAPDGQPRWSIGYGTPSRPGETITAAEAEQRLAAHLAVAAQRVADLVTVPLSPTQRTALVSFEYNTGGLRASKLLRYLNAGDIEAAADQFDRWVYWLPHGHTTLQVAPGLETRRAQEKQLFLS